MDTYALERSWKPCSRSSFSGSCPAATSFLSTKHKKNMYYEKIYQDDGIHYVYFSCITNFQTWNLWVSTFINLQKLLILFLMYCTAVLNFSKIIYRNETTRIMKNLYFNQQKVMPYNQATHYRTCTCNFSKKRC